MEGQRPTPAPAKRDIPWTLVLFAALAVYAILLVVLNAKKVEVRFVFYTAEISLLVLIVLCLGIGFAAGYLFDKIRERRKARAAVAP
jgi:uncharacterized integral membrane protein